MNKKLFSSYVGTKKCSPGTILVQSVGLRYAIFVTHFDSDGNECPLFILVWNNNKGFLKLLSFSYRHL